MRNWCSGVVTAILAVTTGMWLAIPLIDSMRAGTRQQATVEAQAMAASRPQTTPSEKMPARASMVSPLRERTR